MQLCMVFPWKSASAISKPDLDFPNVIWAQGVAWALLFLAGEEEAGCKCRKGKKTPLLVIPGAPLDVHGPKASWLQVAAFPEHTGNPAQRWMHAVVCEND